MSFVPAVCAKPPFLDFPGVKLGPSVGRHQSWKYIDSDPSSPSSVQPFLHCPSLPQPTPSSQSQRDLQRRQLTFLLLAFSRTSVTLLLAFWMSSKAGSFCLRKGRGEPHPLRCVFAHGCWPHDVEPCFCGGARLWTGPVCCVSMRLKAVPQWTTCEFTSSLLCHTDIDR